MVAARIKDAAGRRNGERQSNTTTPSSPARNGRPRPTWTRSPRPNAVVIRRVDGHSVWVNSEALRQSGHHPDTEIALRRAKS